MNTFKVLLYFFLCLFFNNIHSQTGPGGVGANDGSSSLIIWYRPDSGVSTTGSLIDSWTNSAGLAAFNISESGSQRPTLATGTVNGYDEINFYGNNRLRTGLTLTTSNFIVNQASSFIVAKASNTSQISSVYTTDPLVGSTRFSNHIPWSGTVYYDMGTCCSSSARIQVGGLSGLTAYSIWSYDAHPTTGKQLYRNENLLQSRANTSTYSSHASQRFNLGGNTSGTNGFSGSVTELVIFKNKVNTAQRIIIDNYLAAKYNQPLSTNDIYVQDDTGNGNFDHNVAGIGQANDSSNHTDSRGTGIVRISNPSALADNEFLFWGEESRNPTYNFTTNTINYTEQLNSRWRVNKQGNLGTLTVSFDISTLNLTGKQSCSQLQLVVDNNYDFSSPDNVYNLTIIGNTASATGVMFQNNRYFTLRYADEIVWDGSSYFNGSGGLNAPNTSDACLKLIIKSGITANLTNNAHVREVEIEPGATLNVADGILLETDNQVVINGTVDLLGEAQLIQNHTGTSLNSGTGSLNIRQQGTSNLFNYNYLSSPVNRSGTWQVGYLEDANGIINFTSSVNANPATAPITISNRWLYSFQGPSNDYNSWANLSTTTNLSPGIGFTMKGSGTAASEQEYIFSGIPNDGTYIYPVSANTDFLIGNPYPSTLDANQFILDNLSVIDGSLYFWESFTANNSHYLSDYEGGYSTYNLMMPLPAVADASGLTSGNGSASKAAPTQYISIGQGFFTQITNSGTLSFNNNQRYFARESLGETIYYKSSSGTKNKATIDTRPKVWLSFTSPDNYSKTIGLGYDNHATYSYDKGYDAISYDNLKNDFYWLLDDKPLAIQALAEINLEDDLPLGIKISDAGFYKFSISKEENIPDDLNVYLLDKDENIYYNLKEGNAQIFLGTGNFNQFSIVFKEPVSLGTILSEKKNIYASYNSNTKLLELHTVEPITNIESLKIYNALGQVIMDIKKPNTKSINVSNLQNSVYFLKVITKSIKDYKSIKFVKH